MKDWADKNGTIPTKDRIFKARENVEDFQWYCENFLSVVVGKQIFQKKRSIELMSKLAMRSDEAMVLLHVENSIEKWTAEYNDREKKETAKWPDPLYTKQTTESKKYEGWSKRGIARFRDLQTKYVPEMRKTYADIEKQLLKKYTSSGRGSEGIHREYEFFSLLESEEEEESVHATEV